MGTGKLLVKPNKLRGNDLRWTSIPSKGSRNTPSCFILQKPGKSSRSYDPVGSKASFFFILCQMNTLLLLNKSIDNLYKSRKYCIIFGNLCNSDCNPFFFFQVPEEDPSQPAPHDGHRDIPPQPDHGLTSSFLRGDYCLIGVSGCDFFLSPTDTYS